MREPSLDRLRTLVTIADLGSFVAASRQLHLAPPTVSLHVSDLESQIGAPLLIRERGRVLPTGIGATSTSGLTDALIINPISAPGLHELRRGGYLWDGSHCGLFSAGGWCGLSFAWWNCGGRLSVLGRTHA